MAGRSRATRPEFYRSEAYAKFLFNLADFHMASRFPESLTFQSNFISIPPLTHISNFIWHMANSTSMQLTKFQLLIANLLRCRSGPDQNKRKDNKSGDPVNPIGSAVIKTLFWFSFLLIFIIKYVIILKKDIQTLGSSLKLLKTRQNSAKI